MEDKKVVLITGCSSGIGLETAIQCAKKGYMVFATLRNTRVPSELKKRMELEKLNNIEIIEMDVSNRHLIENAISKIIRKTKRIDVLFNNAGFMIVGSLEDSSINEIKTQIDTDLLGPIVLTKFIIPYMKNANPGLIINMSSVAGKIGLPLSSSYCSSKFGIEGFTESLRRELSNKNINVCMIEAGIVHSKFFDNMLRAKQSFHSIYAKETEEMMSVVNKIKDLKSWSNPIDVANKVIQIIEENGKECRYVVGNDAKFLIDSIHESDDDCTKIDLAINQIMKRYLE